LTSATQFLSNVRPQSANEMESWRQYAHALLASNEFLFID
jgi:hypothetical protein